MRQSVSVVRPFRFLPRPIAIGAIVIALAGALGGPASAQEAPYTVVPLTLPPDGNSTSVLLSKMNLSGQVVGFGTYGDAAGLSVWEPIVWSRNGDGSLLPPFPGSFEHLAAGINDSGLIVGAAIANQGGIYVETPVVWQNGAVLALPQPESPFPWDTPSARATAINDDGHIVGFGRTSVGKRALLWTRNGSQWNAPIALDQLVPGSMVGGSWGPVASGINSGGVIAGSDRYYMPGSLTQFDHAVLWGPDGHILADLGALAEPGMSDPSAINDGGMVAGTVYTPGAGLPLRPVVWEQNSQGAWTISYLPTLPGSIYGLAHGINSLGQIVGDSGSPVRATLWQKNADGLWTATDLNSLLPADSGLTMVWGDAINDAGRIAGTAVTAGGQSAAVAIVPPNRAPLAAADTAFVAINQFVVVPVLANDTDLDFDPLTVISVTQGNSGTVVINADNTVTYTPRTSFSGTDTFSYVISDGNGGTASATVTVTVDKPNAPPHAVTDVAHISAGSPTEIAVLANDVDPDRDAIALSGVDPLSREGGSVLANGDGTVTYTAPAGFRGQDTFTYSIKDTHGNTAVGRVIALVK